MAQYPTSAASFTTKESLKAIEAEHVNAIQDEITAITAALLQGINHNMLPSADAVRDLGAVAKRWRDLILSRNMTVGRDMSVAGTAVAVNAAVTGGLYGTLVGDGSGVTGVTGAAAPLPAGTILLYGGAAAPAGWLLCDGSAVDRTTYADLFAAIGETFGVGDGSTTFNLPDLRQRFPMGANPTLAETGGEIDHTHTIPGHAHDVGTLTVESHSHSVGTLAAAAHDHAKGTLATSSAGSHNHTVNSHTHGAGSYAVSSHSHTISSLMGGSIAPPPPGGSSGATSLSSPTGSAAPAVSGTSGSASPGTNSTGSHTHTITGVVGSASPAISGSTASAQPAMSGSVAEDGGGSTGAANPAFVVVNFIIKT